MGLEKVLGLPGGEGTLAGAHAAFVLIGLREGAAWNPAWGPVSKAHVDFSPNLSFWSDALGQWTNCPTAPGGPNVGSRK